MYSGSRRGGEPGADIDFDDLLVFLAEQMPLYLVPRYFELISELPNIGSPGPA
jgi:hypothetical protein